MPLAVFNCPEYKRVAQRLAANKGGREEENRRKISATPL
jgi:hypothetical protein